MSQEAHITINRRPIKGFIGNIELLRRLNQDVIDEMDGSQEWLASAFYSAKSRVALETRNVTALKYAARSAFSDAGKAYYKGDLAKYESRQADGKRLLTKHREAIFDLNVAISTMKQTKVRYDNVRTIIFTAKSTVALCDSVSKEAE